MTIHMTKMSHDPWEWDHRLKIRKSVRDLMLLDIGVPPTDENALLHSDHIKAEKKQPRWAKIMASSITEEQKERVFEIIISDEGTLEKVASYLQISQLKLSRMLKNESGDFVDWYKEALEYKREKDRLNSLAKMNRDELEVFTVSDEATRQKFIRAEQKEWLKSNNDDEVATGTEFIVKIAGPVAGAD